MDSVGEVEVGSSSMTGHAPGSHSLHRAETLPIQPGIPCFAAIEVDVPVVVLPVSTDRETC